MKKPSKTRLKPRKDDIQPQRDENEDGNKVTDTFRWQAVERRGFWYVEFSHDVSRREFYCQISLSYRDWESFGPDNVFAFSKRDLAEGVASALNAACAAEFSVYRRPKNEWKEKGPP